MPRYYFHVRSVEGPCSSTIHRRMTPKAPALLTARLSSL